ncbi:MAG: type II toxin-antitoxin system RelB/DinJ family antitoxin [Kiritimatiellae bacterium]|nr:type II toxin-antitoxin system RelB/DinJ family antitoxin [Kiritimatiellia bacterium]
MARTSNIFARIDPEIKEQAEQVLEQLGIPMSNAIGLFLRQVVMQRGIPFDMKLPQNKPLAFGSLSEEQFNAELEKGLADLAGGSVISAEDVAAKMNQDFGV